MSGSAPVKHPYIWTAGGPNRRWMVQDLQPDMIDRKAIVYGLGKECRFARQIEGFYTVAQHSVYVRSFGDADAWERFMFLMHDAAEAWLGDQAKPIKVTLPDYNRLEEEVMAIVARRFHLPNGFHKDPRIKEVDNRMLVTEAMQLFDCTPPWLDDYLKAGVRPYNITIEPLDWQEAMDQFKLYFDLDYRNYMKKFRRVSCQRQGA